MIAAVVILPDTGRAPEWIAGAQELRRRLVCMLLLALGGIANAGGADIFTAHCAICHQPDGAGVPGMYPPLVDSVGNYVKTAEGRAYLVRVISFGMTGPISVHGQMYAGMMQSWPSLTDDEVAQVFNYILTNFNSRLLPRNFAPLSAEEAKRDRAVNTAMGDIRKEREALMKALDDKTDGS